MMDPSDKRGARDDDDGAATAASKKRKTMPNTSFIWDHFQRSEDKKSIACIHCVPLGTTIFAYSGGTSTMTRHLRRKHGIFAPGKSEQDYERPPSSSSTTLSFFDKASDERVSDDKVPKPRHIKSHHSRHTLQWIQYVTTRYASLALDADLAALLHKGGGAFQPLQGAPLRTALLELAQAQRAALQTYLDAASPALSLSVHEWTSSFGVDAVVVTGHWITEDFEQRQCVLDTYVVMPSDKDGAVVAALRRVLAQYKVDVVGAITVEPQWHTPALAEAFPDTPLISCLVRQIDDVMLAALGVSMPLVLKARQLVVAQHDDHAVVVELDQPQHWWSTLEMLQQPSLATHPSWTSDEQQQLHALVALLTPAYTLLKQMASSSSAAAPPLASLVFGLLHGILLLLLKNAHAKPFLALLQPILHRSNAPLALVCVLDPRFKTLPFLGAAEKQQAIDAVVAQVPPKPSVPSSTQAPPPPPTSSWSELYPFDDPHAPGGGDMQMYMDSTTPNDLVEPLAWWKVHRHVYPDLAGLARKYLAMSPIATPIDELLQVQHHARKKDIPPALVPAYVFVRSASRVPELVAATDAAAAKPATSPHGRYV
ncbi:Aste57867_466 [Aphanomyces stellatus]|uniref:Aste57867_466 protein n=1 Tax=Aphanomyces stellatus TaxID=120398 RepID=A0A485K5C5_9STRA|nr:hypothetical protein As57867_000465 [Aphanomyces stellatus]VFT77691.1 Aste57867_466 [Aphanomyces stellatus]